MSIWGIFTIIWITGILIGIYKLANTYLFFHKTITSTGTDVTLGEPYHSILEDICNASGKKNSFRVFKVPNVSSPLVFGIKTPYIVFPDSLVLGEQDIYYTLRHEAAHIFNHDLWLKFLLQILCICYWWNPFVPLLRKQISMILEIRVDEKISDSSNKNNKIEYIECLLRIAKVENNNLAESSVICKATDTMLIKRFKMMTADGTTKKPILMKQFLFSFAIIAIYLFSVFFIFEPSSIPADIERTTVSLTKDNAYLIKNPNGGYDIYLEHEYYATIDTLVDNFKDFSIYNNIDEVIRND